MSALPMKSLFADMDVFHYDVTITPDVPPKLNKIVWEEFCITHKEDAFGGMLTVYDGRKNLFAPKELPCADPYSDKITIPEHDGSINRKAPREFTVKLKKAAIINLEELHRFIQKKAAFSGNCQTGIMALDVLIGYKIGQEFITVNRNFYTPHGAQSINGGLEVWQGYYQSLRPGQGKMFINVDTSATTFYEGLPMHEAFARMLGARSVNDLRQGVQERDRIKLDKALKKIKIRVRHRGEAIKRQFTVFKITPTSADHTFFELQDGTRTNVADYFRSQYGLRLAYPFLPCVVIQKDSYLPPEVCEIVQGQRYLKKMSDRQTADMIKFTCQSPDTRAIKVADGMKKLNYAENEYLRQFGMKVQSEMQILDARILPPPTMQFHPQSREEFSTPMEGTWTIDSRKRFFNAVELSSWAVVVWGQEQEIPARAVEMFVRQLVQAMVEMGMNVTMQQPPLMRSSPQGNVDDTLKTAWTKACQCAREEISKAPQLIICIMPNIGRIKPVIKRIAETKLGVMTQCCLKNKIMLPKRQYNQMLALKINTKLGGINNILRSGEMPLLEEKPTIIFGCDVTHAGPGDNRRPSIAAMIGSMDSYGFRYASAIRLQQSRVETIQDLTSMAKELLIAYYRKTGKKPARIIAFRDGVSEGQFAEVMKTEIDAIKRACYSLEESYRPPITFIVVQKRHHARFFPINRSEADRSGNCMPGTVVDATIVHPYEYDFYIQSHPGLQGTSRPTHYHVLLDESKIDVDKLQDMTYKLCYLYGRCSRAVSVCPPSYYAHLVAYRTGEYMKALDESESATSSSEAGSTDFSSSSFVNVTVKPEIAKTMYFM
ncbi:Piwi domain-containing protein [Jimgerdemannia flammicorona]|uniref:Piwi domain-containing protein n=1 Tax=Jimgerdemannia flammicorona TaxID=994334 RepID=A0A433DI71_9FUNG|nr:Piwi domain-containing protein [Jimgerdemannia flammicorona]